MDFSSLQENPVTLVSMVIVAYLLGSISSAILVCRLFRLPDPRTEGSNNPGATNVMRLGGKKAAAITLLGDVLKGVIPVLIAPFLGLGALATALVGVAAFIGHLWPVFFRFEGGKGVATAYGVIFALYWPLGVITGVTWLAVFLPTRISSLASLLAFAGLPISSWFLLPASFAPLLLMSTLLIIRHHANIRRLLSGEEFGFKKTPDA